MALLTPGKINERELLDAEENSDVSTIGSIFAGIGTGLIEIPKGLFSLGEVSMT